MDTQQQKPFNVLLIGDTCLDIYLFGNIDRLSPEAPVPVFVPTRQEEREGMAGNVYANLKKLGCNVQIVCGHNSKKTRLVDERSKQHIVRIDEDVQSEPIVFETALPPIYDAIVICDYNKGTITYELVEELRSEFKGPIFIDTKKTDLQRFKNCFVKINSTEFDNTVSVPYSQDLIVTLGAKGTMYQTEIYPVEEIGVVDVTGAGDTFLAALTYNYLKTKDVVESIKFANKASSVTVQKFGVYAPSLEEIV